MKRNLSKTDAQDKINDFFSRDSFSSEDVRKIKRLAMKYRIRLGKYRRLFCKHCLSQLKGKTRVTRTTKTIVCHVCGHLNRFRL